MGGEKGEEEESNLRRVGRWRNGSRGEVGGGRGEEEEMGSMISSSTLIEKKEAS